MLFPAQSWKSVFFLSVNGVSWKISKKYILYFIDLEIFEKEKKEPRKERQTQIVLKKPHSQQSIQKTLEGVIY